MQTDKSVNGKFSEPSPIHNTLFALARRSRRINLVLRRFDITEAFGCDSISASRGTSGLPNR